MKVKQVQTRKKEGAAAGFRAARRERQSSPAAFNPIALFSLSTEHHGLRPKLKVGSPGDIYEQEADQMADRVMSMAGPVTQRQIEEEEEQEQEEPIQTTPLIQRQTEEEEEPIQEKSLLWRQTEEQEEGAVQTYLAISHEGRSQSKSSIVDVRKSTQPQVVQRAPGNPNPLQQAAGELHDAIAGAATDEDAVHRVLGAHRGKGAAIEPFYQTVSGGESLKTALMGDLGGHHLFRAFTAYYGGLQRAQEAELLYTAMHGVFTDDDLFWAVLTPYASRSNAQRRALMAAYDRYGNLMADIKADFSGGDFRKAVGMLTLTSTPPLTQAGQEAKAQKTLTLCWNTAQWMKNQRASIYKNTALLLLPDAKGERRLLWNSMTLRHDNAEMVARRGEDPRTRAYFFVGVKEDNSRHGPPDITAGVLNGNTIYIRGVDAPGTTPTERDVADAFIHEASHILVTAYGEHPAKEDPASFDRYKDEFRAYWVEPHGLFPPSNYATEDARARAIRNYIIGPGPQPGRSVYPESQQRYWGSADRPQSKSPDREFRRQVDAHTRPDGFNLELNPRLDRLFGMLNDYPTFFTHNHYLELLDLIRNDFSNDERTAARSSPLIQRLIANKIQNVVERRVVQNALGIK